MRALPNLNAQIAARLEEVAALLELQGADRFRVEAYRRGARRFNPGREARLPVLHTERGAHHYTALFSNTARAHALGRTRDWVDYGSGKLRTA